MAKRKEKPNNAKTRLENLQNNYVDLTKTGPLSYREFAYLMGDDRPYTPSNSIVAANQPKPVLDNLIDSPHGVQYIQSNYGNSIYDPEGYATEGEIEQLNEIRAENQPWYAQIGAGIAKGAVLAGTTFLDGTLGLLFGGAEAIRRGDLSGLWDNEFSKAMQSINEWSEQVMPNYYTREETEEPWYKNIFTANWLGDKLIKNLGFSIGALYSGGVATGGLKALKIPQLIGKITKSVNAPRIVSSAIGATLSAVNEGRIEALNNSNDWQNLKMQELDDYWQKRINNKYSSTIQSLTNEYQKALAEFKNTGDNNKKALALALGTKLQQVQEQANAEFENRNSDNRYQKIAGRIAEDRLKMGNMDLLFNIPILTASNLVQFTKYYARGFNTGRKTGVGGSIREGFKGKEFTKLGAGTAIAKAGLSEGTEEISQKAASLVSGNYYSTDVNNYRKSQFDKNSSQETLDWAKAFATGINETINDASSWEEFTIGAITGFMGIPMFRSMKNADGKFQSPIYLEGGAREAYKNYKKDVERSQEIARYLNERVQSPEFQNYYRSLVRHNKYQKDMNQALIDDDEFNFKNAEHAQFVSDINMFNNAGRLDELKDYISEMYDVSDEELEAIIDQTTSENENGDSIGPFIDKKGNRLTSTEEGKEEMRKKLTEEKDAMLRTINNYRKTKDTLDVMTGGELTDEQLSELTWMSTQIDDWNDRANDMIPIIRKAIVDLDANLSRALTQKIADATMEGEDTSTIEAIGKVSDEFGIGGKRLNQLQDLAKKSDEELKGVLTNPKNKKFVEGLVLQIENLGSDIIGSLEARNITRLLKDLPKIGEGIESYNKKLKEYLSDPAKLAEDQARTDKEAEETFKQETKKTLRDKLSSATSISEFKEIFNEEENEDTKDGVLSDLIDEGNQVAKNYKETTQYDTELRLALSQLGETDQTTQDALSLWQEQVNLAENLEQIAYSDSVAINNDEAFMEGSDGDVELASTRFENARYALQRAMSKVNNNIKFKNRFSEEYRKPVDEPVQGKGTDKDETGDSGTPTVPHVNPGAAPVEVPSAPVGNVTAEMIAAENSDANRRVETQRTLDQRQQGQRRYYRPVIPELHIEASKEGDFRPFDVVAAEREPGKDFSEIYNYLRDNGAFDYVNRGKLKAGQTLLFMIDPEFEQSVEGKPWHTAPTVFLTTEDGQVVGSLDEGSSIASFEGLEGLVQKVRDEYQASRQQPSQQEVRVKDTNRNTTARFFATPKTKVSKIMVGRVPYTSEERSLADIPGVIDGDTKPILGIIKNGVLTTNGKINDRLIIKPIDMAQKEGRLYLLIPNAAGTYSPTAVRVKHFNTQEFNLDNATVAATPISKGINDALDKLASATSQDDVSIAMKELAQDIYMQDVMVTWFDAKAGSGIVVSKKVRRPDGTYEMVTINGQEQSKEEKTTIYFQSSKAKIEFGGMEFTKEIAEQSVKEGTLDPAVLNLFGQPRDTADIRKDILNTILRYNLPLQVSVSKINGSGYNNRVIKSNILTSNLREAKVIGSWFTTDYFDNQGNLQRAISPASVKPTPGRKASSPVGGTEGVIQGTRVFISGTPYIVDLKSSIAINEKTGERRAFSAFNSQLLIDMAWAQETFGDTTESSVMTENKIITPKGDVLDRNTGHYITGEEAQRIKDKIAGRDKEAKNRVAKSKKVVADIYENQKKVDKTRTDSNYYYILEDDGQYHKYDRVHSRLGDNWLGKKTESENSRRALEAGTAVDKVIRDFFTSKETPVRPDVLSEEAFSALVSRLTEIKSNMEQMGETFLANNIVLFHKYADGTRVAGEVDILSVDKNGNFKIYDVKTSRYSFSDRYFNEKTSMQRMSTKDYYTLQLSAYQNLFESQYGVRPTRLAILPFVLTYDKDKVSSITQEKGIPITYNPAVNVPLASAVQAPRTEGSLPIFDSTMETMITNPEEQNRVLPENAFEEGGEVGYYEKDGKLYTGYCKKIGEVEVTYGSGQKDMVPIHVTKVRDRGYGKGVNANSEYLTVFPNGKAISTRTNDTNDNHAAEIIMKALSAKPEKVLSLSNEKTQIHNPIELEESDTTVRTAQESTPQGGASKSIQKNDSVNQHDDEFEDDLVLSERDKSPINYRGQEFIFEDIPSMVGKNKSRVRAYLKIGYSLEQISNMIGEDLLKLAGARGRIWDSLSREQRVIIAKGFNPKTTSFDSEYSEKGYSMNTEYQVEDIESLINSELYRSPLFQKVLSIAKQFGITVQFRNRAISDTAEGLYGYNKIYIQISPNSPYFEQVIMHELIHSVTQGLINREGTGELTSEQEESVKILRSVFESVQDKYGKDSWYGLSNLAEFVAELANPKFREFLKAQEIEKGTSLWDKIKSFFKKLFGNKLELSDTTLERILENPIRDTDKNSIFQKSRGRTLLNKDLSQSEKQFIQGFILNLNAKDRLSGRANIYNPNTGYYYTVNFSSSIKGHLDNLKEGRDGFEVMDKRRGLKSSMTANWNRLDSDLQLVLIAKGWTQEKFNSISQEERDQAIKCIAL